MKQDAELGHWYKGQYIELDYKADGERLLGQLTTNSRIVSWLTLLLEDQLAFLTE